MRRQGMMGNWERRPMDRLYLKEHALSLYERLKICKSQLWLKTIIDSTTPEHWIWIPISCTTSLWPQAPDRTGPRSTESVAGEAGALQLRVNFSLRCVSPLSPSWAFTLRRREADSGTAAEVLGQSLPLEHKNEAPCIRASERRNSVRERKSSRQRRGDPKTQCQETIWGFYTWKNKQANKSRFDWSEGVPARLARALDWVWGLSPTSFPFQESPWMGGCRLALFPKITCTSGLFLS